MSEPLGNDPEVDNTEDDDAAAEALATAQAAAEAEETEAEARLDPKVKAKLDKVNREARNLRQRIKDLEPLAAKAQAAEDATKTEVQRLTDQLTANEAELHELRVERVRNQAGAEAKLDPDMWEFITASDPDEARAQAKRLASRIAAQEAGPANMRQGSRPPAKTGTTPNDALRTMAGYQ